MYKSFNVYTVKLCFPDCHHKTLDCEAATTSEVAGRLAAQRIKEDILASNISETNDGQEAYLVTVIETFNALKGSNKKMTFDKLAKELADGKTIMFSDIDGDKVQMWVGSLKVVERT